MVQQDEHLAHKRIQDSFRRFGDIIDKYMGKILELRGDALLAEFERASEAVTATLAFQSDHAYYLSRLQDELKPGIRVGIAMGEVVMADGTVTGAGVVLAQRVEQLTDSGGLCITAAVHESLPKRMPFDLENLGEHQLKGFDDSVRIYKVELRPGESIPSPEESHKHATPPKTRRHMVVAVVAITLVIMAGTAYWYTSLEPKVEAASIERMAFPLPDKPSIAVLPFANLSDNKQQEYFADGMTEDLITDISKVTGLFVIARNSVFTYKGKPVKVRQVAEELGVRYVMEGSVRRVGNQVRINAQLIDATTGGHLWAERYDGSLDDVFALQDRVTKRIVTALSIRLTAGEQVARAIADTTNPRAYDAFLQGREHYRRWNIDAFGQAVPFFKEALAHDPDYAQAHAALAAIYWQSWRRWGERGKPWPPGMGVKQENFYDALDLAKAHLEEAMRRLTPLAHQLAARMHLKGRRYAAAIAEAERAVALDPGNADAHATLAYMLVFGGNAEAAAAAIAKAMRLDPHYPPNYLDISGIITFALGDLAGAAELLRRRYQKNPEDQETVPFLVSALMQIGRVNEGSRLFDKYDGYKHNITSDYSFWPFKDLDVFERYARGWVAAGGGLTGELKDLMKELRANEKAQP